MNIDMGSSPLTSLSRAVSQTTKPTARLIYDTTGTGFTAGDVKLLRAVSGRDDFVWPPDPNKPDQLIPAVLPLTGHRADRVARGHRISELNVSDIRQLVAMGIFNAEDGNNAMDYVRNEGAAGGLGSANATPQSVEAGTDPQAGLRVVGGESRLHL